MAVPHDRRSKRMVLRNTFFISCCAILWVACGSSSGDTANTTDPITPEQAKTLFIRKCATCHGTEGNMEIGGAKNLTLSTLSKEEVLDQIRHGKGNMPPFGEVLTTKEIEAITQHTLSIRTK